MFQLDDKFLEEVGLADLPEEQKKPFLQHTYKEIEERVGMRLSEGMNEAQLDEFAAIIDRKMDIVEQWLSQHSPNYREEEIFQRLQQASGLSVDDPALKAEYTATKWLEVNRPDYRDVVARTFEEMKKEIIASKDAILGNDQPAAA